MKKLLTHPLAACALLTYVCMGIAAVNPITVTFVGGTTSFSPGPAPGTANYVVAVNSGVIPPNVPLALHLASAGNSAGLTATQQLAISSPCAGVSNLCGSTFALTAGQNCCLAFTLTSNVVGNYTLQPTVSTTPSAFSGEAPSALTVMATNAPTIGVSPTSVTLIEGGSSSCVTVTNQSSTDAVQNLSAAISPGNSEVTIDNSGTTCASTLAASGTCSYCFLPGTQEETPTAIISGDNIAASVDVPITVGAASSTTLTVPATGIIPVNNSTGSLVITNTGSNIAYNVHAMLPVGWTAVSQTDCVTIPANGGTCSLLLSSTTPYLAEGGIQVTGDNITTPPSTALAFSIQGYLVFALSSDSSSDPQVVDTVDLSNDPWGTIGVSVPGAHSPTDGFINTAAIEATPLITPSAAVDCYNRTNGGVSSGTWYLPAICQMGGLGQGAGCNNGNETTIDNLLQLGFISIDGAYWSSTEQLPNLAWLENFGSGGNSSQGFVDKNFSFGVCCSRAITY